MIDLQGKIELLQSYQTSLKALESARRQSVVLDNLHVSIRSGDVTREFVVAFEKSVRENFASLRDVAVLALGQAAEEKRKACERAGLTV